MPPRSAASRVAEPEPRVLKLCELEPGQTGDCFVLLSGKESAKTRDGKPFYRATFRDLRRSVTAMIWSDGGWFEDCDQRWLVGGFYKVRGRYFENQFGPQFELEKIRPIEEADRSAGFDPGDFHPSSRFDPDQMLSDLRQLAEEHISELPLRRLVVRILDDRADQVREMAAASHHHHAFRGGFLEHVLSVTRTAVYLADKYRDQYPRLEPPLSKSLVVAGAILHDIGKTIELQQRPGGAEYTAAGRLIGHIVLGRDLVREAAAHDADFDPEILLRLEHIILAHQAVPEWGSPVSPSTPEALLVYYADDIDAKFHMVVMALESERTPGNEEFTNRDNPLKRRIFRGFVTT